MIKFAFDEPCKISNLFVDRNSTGQSIKYFRSDAAAHCLDFSSDANLCQMTYMRDRFLVNQ